MKCICCSIWHSFVDSCLFYVFERHCIQVRDMRSALIVALLLWAAVAEPAHADALSELLGEPDSYPLLDAGSGSPGARQILMPVAEDEFDVVYDLDDADDRADVDGVRLELSETHRLPLEPKEHMPAPPARGRLRRQAASPPYRLYVGDAFRYTCRVLQFDGSGYLKADLSRVSIDMSATRAFVVHLVVNASDTNNALLWYYEPSDRSKTFLISLQVRSSYSTCVPTRTRDLCRCLHSAPFVITDYMLLSHNPHIACQTLTHSFSLISLFKRVHAERLPSLQVRLGKQRANVFAGHQAPEQRAVHPCRHAHRNQAHL